MASLNVASRAPRTHEGAVASIDKPIEQLRRSIMTCLLWESNFYENGVDVATRIASLVPKCDPSEVAALAIEARQKMHVRHAPLLVLSALSDTHKANAIVSAAIPEVCQRVDDMTEFLAIYWKAGRRTLPRHVRSGLTTALRKFDAYQLAKYDRAKAVKLRDLLRMIHPKPVDAAQAGLWKSILDGTIQSPDTWEVALSSGSDKRVTWERLISENRLGGLALLRNLRNMLEAGVADATIRDAINANPFRRVLPFRFVAAAKHAPRMVPALDAAIGRAIGSLPKFGWPLTLLIDVSGSMDYPISQKSEMNRMDAAAALAMMASGMSSDLRVFTFSNHLVEVAPVASMAMIENIKRSQPNGGTYLGAAVNGVPAMPEGILVVVTDEQAHDNIASVPAFRSRYMVNVACEQHGVAIDPSWRRINGWSEAIVSYIRADLGMTAEALED